MLTIKPKYLNYLIRSLPNLLWPIKWFILHKSLKKVGNNFRFSSNSIFSDHRLIEIGDNVFFGYGTIINTIVSIRIGNGVMFGPEVMIMGGDHNYSVVGKKMRDIKEGGFNKPVIIEDDVWIGSRTIILKGVKIGEGSVVGAGSLVTKNLPPYSVCVGNPCNPLKCRFSYDDLKEHLRLISSIYSFEEIESQFHQWGINLK